MLITAFEPFCWENQRNRKNWSFPSHNACNGRQNVQNSRPVPFSLRETEWAHRTRVKKVICLIDTYMAPQYGVVVKQAVAASIQDGEAAEWPVNVQGSSLVCVSFFEN